MCVKLFSLAACISDGFAVKWRRNVSYPKAALFGFAVAVLCYNAFSVTKAAIRASHVDPASVSPLVSFDARDSADSRPGRDDLSTYYLADEIAGTWRGMMVVLPEPFWKQKFADLSAVELAEALKDLAGRADTTKYRQRAASKKRSVRKPPCQPGSHVSTARILKTGRLKRNGHL
jgi:hypothetical protein